MLHAQKHHFNGTHDLILLFIYRSRYGGTVEEVFLLPFSFVFVLLSLKSYKGGQKLFKN